MIRCADCGYDITNSDKRPVYTESLLHLVAYWLCLDCSDKRVDQEAGR